jgi:hypothetical protein
MGFLLAEVASEIIDAVWSKNSSRSLPWARNHCSAHVDDKSGPGGEVLPIISRTDQDGKRESASIASKEPESELVRGTLGEVGQRRMSVEADPVWSILAAASVASNISYITTKSATIRAKTIGSVSFADGGKERRLNHEDGEAERFYREEPLNRDPSVDIEVVGTKARRNRHRGSGRPLAPATRPGPHPAVRRVALAMSSELGESERGEVSVRESDFQRWGLRKAPRSVGAARRSRGLLRSDAALAELSISRGSPFPLGPDHRPKSSSEPLAQLVGRESVGATGRIESCINKDLQSRCAMAVSIFLVWNHCITNFASI